MAYAHKVVRMTISGTCFLGAEEWSTGFYLGASGVDATAPTQTWVDDVATYWQTFFTAANSKISNRYQTTQVKAALLNTDGTTVSGSVQYHMFATPISGAYTVNHNVPQCSLAVTLTSAIPRGGASKGRMYLPGYAPAIGTDGHISSTDITALSGTVSTFLNAINADIDQPGRLILASKSDATLGRLAVNADITGYKIGNVYDTQRRRRNGLVETYTAGTVA